MMFTTRKGLEQMNRNTARAILFIWIVGAGIGLATLVIGLLLKGM